MNVSMTKEECERLDMTNFPKVEIKLDAAAHGTITVDGQAVKGVRKLTVVSEVGNLQHVELEFFADDIDLSTPAIVLLTFTCQVCGEQVGKHTHPTHAQE